jgi:VWFA-related protein
MTSLLVPLLDMAAELVDVVTPRDRLFLIAFNERPHLIHPPTVNAASLRSKLFDQYASGGTALADALAFSLQQFRSLPGRKALVLITDGNEGASDQNARACIGMARESGVPIYVIVPKESGDIENAVAFRRVLREIADTTGGLYFERPRETVFERIRDDVRGQYLLSFNAPPDAIPGRWRSIRVQVARAGARVRTISGYYAGKGSLVLNP